MERSKIIKTSIVMMVIVVIIISYYYYLSTRNEEANSQQATEESVVTEMTAVQELIAMSKYKEYPTTPVQVVKYYNEITSCFYNEVYTEDEFTDLVRLTQTLYDPELNANMTFDQYTSQLKDDIAVFRAGNITIYDSQLTPATDVEYFTKDGYECARLFCLYTLKSGAVYQSSREVYILRKDIGGHWKIMGFALAVDDDK